MTHRSGYNIQEAVRKVASATAYRALFLEDSERPTHDEKRMGLAIAVALYYNLNPFEIENFIQDLNAYLRERSQESIFRDPSLYE